MEVSISDIIWQGILLLLLIVLSAFFSAFEAAVSSLNKIKLQCYYKNNLHKMGYKILCMYLDNYGMTISSILTGNNLVAVAASTVSTLFFNNICLHANVADPISLAAGLSTGIITFLLLIFGEFVPKSIARNHNIKFLTKTLYFGVFFYFLFWPISYLLNFLVNRKQKDNVSFNEHELSLLVNQIKHEGAIENNKALLITKAIDFDNKKVSDILTPLKYVTYIDTKMSYEEIKTIFLDCKYSRLPVVKNKEFIGMLTFKDFFSVKEIDKFNINEILKPLLIYSQHARLDDVLRQMQINRTHLGLVKAKNDSTKIIGVVSLENIIECLVGKIYDEDDDALKLMQINDNTYQVSFDYSAKDFFKQAFKNEDKYWLSIDQKTNMYEWLLNEFKLKKINKTKYENDFLIVTIDNLKKSTMVIEINK